MKRFLSILRRRTKQMSVQDAPKRISVGRECLKVLGKLSRERQLTR